MAWARMLPLEIYRNFNSSVMFFFNILMRNCLRVTEMCLSEHIWMGLLPQSYPNPWCIIAQNYKNIIRKMEKSHDASRNHVWALWFVSTLAVTPKAAKDITMTSKIVDSLHKRLAEELSSIWGFHIKSEVSAGFVQLLYNPRLCDNSYSIKLLSFGIRSHVDGIEVAPTIWTELWQHSISLARYGSLIKAGQFKLNRAHKVIGNMASPLKNNQVFHCSNVNQQLLHSYQERPKTCITNMVL